MVAYRFCRPDDIPALVHAVNRCYDVHFPSLPPLTVEDFQREVRELNVWPSNCMIATSASDPVAVCIATKRPREVLVLRLGTHPDHLRRGHGSHLLSSLGQKLAVLGPPRLAAEIPESWETARLFFEAVGYRYELTYTDFHRDSPLPPLDSSELVIPVGVEEIVDQFPEKETSAWERQPLSWLNRKDQLKGLAVASPDGIDAFVLYRTVNQGSVCEITGFQVREPKQEEVFSSLLLRALARQEPGLPWLLPKLHPDEVSYSVLESLGFRCGRRCLRYAGEAQPG